MTAQLLKLPSAPTPVPPAVDLRGRFDEPHQFPMVFCSQCGCSFGPGNRGYSHCSDHWNERSKP